MIPVIEHEIVRNQKILDREDFRHLFIIAQSAPDFRRKCRWENQSSFG